MLRKVMKFLVLYPLTGCVFSLLGIGLIGALPMFYCQKKRCVRYLLLLGLIYYSSLIIVSIIFTQGATQWGLIFLVIVMSSYGWLLPNPFTFFFRPQQRRAIIRTIEYLETQQYSIRYDAVHVLEVEENRIIVCVEYDDTRPFRREFVAVANDGLAIEELDSHQVCQDYGLGPRR